KQDVNSGCPAAKVTMLPLRHALAVAVVHIFILSESWALAKNINFYNVRPPLDPTPFPNSFKCFTCENAGDNYNCNRWAEDKWCPQNTRYCLTVHHFTSHGRSTSITKKCASRSECHSVGCHHSRDSEHTECRSCCEGMICNVELPTNHSNAVLAVTRAPGTSGGPAPRLQLPGLPALAWASVLLLL
uniref:LY6/PLAUR domain containing 6B n=2 Tax=Canis lupus familiaris TaxID=9615 RepID=A0A8I3N6F5_CANLF